MVIRKSEYRLCTYLSECCSFFHISHHSKNGREGWQLYFLLGSCPAWHSWDDNNNPPWPLAALGYHFNVLLQHMTCIACHFEDKVQSWWIWNTFIVASGWCCWCYWWNIVNMMQHGVAIKWLDVTTILMLSFVIFLSLYSTMVTLALELIQNAVWYWHFRPLGAKQEVFFLMWW